MLDEHEVPTDRRDVTIRQQAELIRQQAELIRQLEEEVARLKALIEAKADAKAAKKPVFKENYSLDRNKKNRKKKPKKKSTGRKPTGEKRDLATKIDRSDDLENVLEQVLSNTDQLKQLSGELGVDEGGDA